MEVLVTGKLHERGLTALRAIPDVTVHYHPDCPVEQLHALVRTCQVLITRSETTIDRDLIARAPHLRIVGRAAVGVANIDLEYATTKGILVVNCPGKNTNAAAELTFALLMTMMRNVQRAATHLQQGGWDRHRFKGRELRQRKLGVIGLGHVGHRVCKFAHGFDMEVYGYDPYLPSSRFSQYDVKKIADLAVLAELCEILTVHVPLNAETRGMIDRDIMRKLGPQGILINAARGDVIVKEDLLHALEHNEIGLVGLDTWHDEPQIDARLRTHAQVFGTPHIGASTEEAQLAIGLTIADQIKKAIEGGVVDFPVNVPYSTVIDSSLHRSFAVLAEKLGSLIGQIITYTPVRVKIRYSHELGAFPLLRLSWINGYLQQTVSDYVSIVNCEAHLQRLGIHLEEETCALTPLASMEVTVSDAHGNDTSVGGVIFDEEKPRLAHIDNYKFEIKPRGRFLLIRNRDLPGVLGDTGNFLATEKINIGSVFLSRQRRTASAMAMIEIDSALSQAALQRMLTIKNVLAVVQINL